MVIHQYASMVLYLFIFFFKQKTAYEVRISDWSSDVCSSNLAQPGGSPPAPPVDRQRRPGRGLCLPVDLRPGSGARACIDAARRSEERRVGKECVSKCRCRWSTTHYQKKQESTQQCI